MYTRIRRQEKKKFIYHIRIMMSMYHENLLRREKVMKDQGSGKHKMSGLPFAGEA